ncbi:hypothetical protein H9Q69_007239 [Fusarium xylarioides]|nr:hypothetical protein H9Q70_002320 [Fusarium xylarioides]KAG5793728.1 hypothetical protein H9Q69_007239 [Fusarium xylarioides]
MKEIAVRTPYTYRQVQHAPETPVTPQKSKPRPYSRRLSPYQLDQLQEFLDDEPANRDVPWQDLQYLLPCLYEPSLDAVKTVMQDLGYYKTIKKKSPLNTPAVPFSDETFVMTFDRGLRLVTIHELEDPKTFTRLLHKGNSRMFWSFICGLYKGSGFVYPRDISASLKSYQYHCLPRFKAFIWQLQQLRYKQPIFMQDGSHVHTAAATMTYLRDHGIEVLDWAPYSPDLNPIKNIWALLKLWIEGHYEVEKLSPQQLEEAILAT